MSQTPVWTPIDSSEGVAEVEAAHDALHSCRRDFEQDGRVRIAAEQCAACSIMQKGRCGLDADDCPHRRSFAVKWIAFFAVGLVDATDRLGRVERVKQLVADFEIVYEAARPDEFSLGLVELF
ncbi:hypothetical protein AQZ50_15565 [Novosphingobium sp. Fuku2-ISO-50]|nr:hypothetical protein AQZ50_15565 [Novosphingobium sp. Fuku2-ISO-50]